MFSKCIDQISTYTNNIIITDSLLKYKVMLFFSLLMPVCNQINKLKSTYMNGTFFGKGLISARNWHNSAIFQYIEFKSSLSTFSSFFLRGVTLSEGLPCDPPPQYLFTHQPPDQIGLTSFRTQPSTLTVRGEARNHHLVQQDKSDYKGVLRGHLS